jgi:hypothetical protein
MKRGILYAVCDREGYNVLALGQHLDDLAESFMMSVFHNGVCTVSGFFSHRHLTCTCVCVTGLLRTMKAHYVSK